MTPALLERTDKQRRFDALDGDVHRRRRIGCRRQGGSVGQRDRRPDHVRASSGQAVRCRCRAARPGHRRRSSLRDLHRSPDRPRRHARRRPRAVRCVGWCSTPPGWSSTWVAGPGCSPVAPAMRCYWVTDGVSGPDAIFAPGAAKPTTPHPGQRTVRPRPTTAGRPARDTTVGNNAATEPGATPTAAGTPTDPTEPKSATSPRHPPTDDAF